MFVQFLLSFWARTGIKLCTDKDDAILMRHNLCWLQDIIRNYIDQDHVTVRVVMEKIRNGSGFGEFAVRREYKRLQLGLFLHFRYSRYRTVLFPPFRTHIIHPFIYSCKWQNNYWVQLLRMKVGVEKWRKKCHFPQRKHFSYPYSLLQLANISKCSSTGGNTIFEYIPSTGGNTTFEYLSSKVDECSWVLRCVIFRWWDRANNTADV